MIRVTWKAKTKQLIIKVLSTVVVLIIIYLGIKLISAIVPGIPTKVLTEKEEREQKYNSPTFGEEKIDKKDVNRFVELIDQYYNFCNKKEYENAYELIHEDCKNKFFPTLESFKQDVDDKFDKLKRYRYKNLLNVGDDYIYNLTLFDDVLAYGTNEMPQEVMYYIIVKDSKDGAKLSLNGYIRTDNTRLSNKFEDGIIAITKKDIYYDHIELKVEITNNSNYLMVIPKSDIKYIIKNKSNTEVKYDIYSTIMQYDYLYALAGSVSENIVSFQKTYDTVKFTDYKLDFNNVYFTSTVNNNRAIYAVLHTDDYIDSCDKKLTVSIGL